MTNRLLTGGECPQGVLDVIEGAIGYLALSNGFAAIEYAALRILSNIFLSFVEDVGASALSHAESTGRTTILLSDVILALIDSGFDLKGLEELPRRRQYRGFKEPIAIGSSNGRGVACSAIIGPSGATIIPRPLSLRSDWPPSGRGMGSGNAQHNTTCAVPEQSLPPPAPAHLHLPGLPEPHTFLHTKVKRPPVTSDPISLRRRVAEQRRKVQQSLVQFLARIQPVQYLFPGDAESFMLLTPKKSSRPYLAALLAESVADASPMDQRDGGQSTAVAKSRAPSSLCLNTMVKSNASSSSLAGNPYLLKPKFPEC
ncbi:transcription initiation factor TFIID subunit 8 [Clonorchis sinensis]|nr:transcription initiation factor TFIID subunit 8 [Clonorchis sinensis]